MDLKAWNKPWRGLPDETQQEILDFLSVGEGDPIAFIIGKMSLVDKCSLEDLWGRISYLNIKIQTTKRLEKGIPEAFGSKRKMRRLLSLRLLPSLLLETATQRRSFWLSMKNLLLRQERLQRLIFTGPQSKRFMFSLQNAPFWSNSLHTLELELQHHSDPCDLMLALPKAHKLRKLSLKTADFIATSILGLDDLIMMLPSSCPNLESLELLGITVNLSYLQPLQRLTHLWAPDCPALEAPLNDLSEALTRSKCEKDIGLCVEVYFKAFRTIAPPLLRSRVSFQSDLYSTVFLNHAGNFKYEYIKAVIQQEGFFAASALGLQRLSFISVDALQLALRHIEPNDAHILFGFISGYIANAGVRPSEFNLQIRLEPIRDCLVSTLAILRSVEEKVALVSIFGPKLVKEVIQRRLGMNGLRQILGSPVRGYFGLYDLQMCGNEVWEACRSTEDVYYVLDHRADVGKILVYNTEHLTSTARRIIYSKCMPCEQRIEIWDLQRDSLRSAIVDYFQVVATILGKPAATKLFSLSTVDGIVPLIHGLCLSIMWITLSTTGNEFSALKQFCEAGFDLNARFSIPSHSYFTPLEFSLHSLKASVRSGVNSFPMDILYQLLTSSEHLEFCSNLFSTVESLARRKSRLLPELLLLFRQAETLQNQDLPISKQLLSLVILWLDRQPDEDGAAIRSGCLAMFCVTDSSSAN